MTVDVLPRDLLVLTPGSFRVCLYRSGQLFVYDCLTRQRTRRGFMVSDGEITAIHICPSKDTLFTLVEKSNANASCSESVGSLLIYRKTENEASVPIEDTTLKLIANNEFICSVSECAIHVISFSSFEVLKRQDTFSNPNACGAISTEPNRTVICCLGLQRGTIRLERPGGDSDTMSSVIAAHESAVVAIALSGNGNHVSTASEKGSLIRVHSTIDRCDLQYEIRRSLILRNVGIASLFMNQLGSLVGCINEGCESVSIFKSLMPHSPQAHLLDASDKASSSIGRNISWIFQKCQEAFSSRPYIEAKIPKGTNKIVAAQFGPEPDTLVIASNSHGFLFRFNLDAKNSLVLQHCGNIVEMEGENTDNLPPPEDWIFLSHDDEPVNSL